MLTNERSYWRPTINRVSKIYSIWFTGDWACGRSIFTKPRHSCFDRRESRGELPRAARALIDDLENELIFSVVSVWEIAIKSGLGKKAFQTDPRLLRRQLLDNGYTELPLLSKRCA